MILLTTCHHSWSICDDIMSFVFVGIVAVVNMISTRSFDALSRNTPRLFFIEPPNHIYTPCSSAVLTAPSPSLLNTGIETHLCFLSETQVEDGVCCTLLSSLKSTHHSWLHKILQDYLHSMEVNSTYVFFCTKLFCVPELDRTHLTRDWNITKTSLSAMPFCLFTRHLTNNNVF